MSKYMGQIMAECDCQHQACEMRGYCMTARIEELEAKLTEAEWRFEHLASYGDTDETRDFAREALAKLEGQDDE